MGLIHDAISDKDIQKVLGLVQSGADLTRRDTLGRTPLGLAVQVGDAAIVMALLDAGAHPDGRRDLSGEHPLHTAARACRIDLLGMLLERGADAEIRNGCGKSPSRIAWDIGAKDCVRLIDSYTRGSKISRPQSKSG